jgi:hypothetical protein
MSMKQVTTPTVFMDFPSGPKVSAGSVKFLLVHAVFVIDLRTAVANLAAPFTGNSSAPTKPWESLGNL